MKTAFKNKFKKGDLVQHSKYHYLVYSYSGIGKEDDGRVYIQTVDSSGYPYRHYMSIRKFNKEFRKMSSKHIESLLCTLLQNHIVEAKYSLFRREIALYGSFHLCL